MMRIHHGLLGLLLAGGLLAACATPQQACTRAAQADLVALDRDIAETEHAIARGYRMTEAVAPRTTLHLCAWPREPVLFCTRHTPGSSAQRLAVDPKAEQARLDSLRARRGALEMRTAQAVAACRAG